jgi:hypothetical protein
MLTPPQKRILETVLKIDGGLSRKNALAAVAETCKLLTRWELGGVLPRLTPRAPLRYRLGPDNTATPLEVERC